MDVHREFKSHQYLHMYTTLWVVLTPWLEYMQLFDITHVSDDCELATTAFYDCYMYIMTHSEAISNWYQYRQLSIIRGRINRGFFF
jgi:hypothetical protein